MEKFSWCFVKDFIDHILIIIKKHNGDIEDKSHTQQSQLFGVCHKGIEITTKLLRVYRHNGGEDEGFDRCDTLIEEGEL